ncbi:uncharacterized protein A4U43_C06F19540 [Asparagus officinalis]|uniref:GTD-binding domain-containing protein n=1 Tax=Asparagus officinalis TaxID=4686 RepID=A0A5P1EQH7_ASPOF|nr:myosin-binding protein 1-like [Asparagus officinalis]XP_020269670.1 myosin-binding protein 1-like [Asparagus officinalis]XP_020269671.1 myosin-binding protein 1-like [Asparagus officinalis]ONK67377.1 uncharacterized protein A4U43_C06F19540 [Asparagus officinalis]
MGSCRLPSVLQSAVCEWLLMSLLFLHASFSFLVTRFARLCKLQAPCLLCSRLDHVFGNEKPRFYVDLICAFHKSEISSFAYCHVHRKLANVNEMCEGCLVSFATEKKSNSETYRLLVGKVGIEEVDENVDGEDVEVSLLTEDHTSGSSVTNRCSCCSVPFRHKSVRVNGRLSRKRENSLVSPSTRHLENHRVDGLSHVGYSEVKANSDSESENPLSEDAEDLKEGIEDRCLNPQPAADISNNLSMSLSDDTITEKLIQPTYSEPESSSYIPEDQLLNVGESRDASLASTVANGHNLEEIKPVTQKDPSYFSDVKSDTVMEKLIQVTCSEPESSLYIPEDQLLNVGEARDASSASAVGSGHDLEEIKPISQRDPSEFLDAKLNVGESPKPLSLTDTSPAQIDLNDAYKLAIGSKGRLTSPTVNEVITGRDSSKIHEDLRLLISQLSAARGLESPWHELSPSPRVHGQGDDLKFVDASSSAILQNITKTLSIERNESGFESFDGSIVSEIEGESPVDRLKRQVELDRKSMYLLYKELEEERNASAIAANQSMAMITRLQEEKASMQMEALQYQRMMEEQSEYDQEAIQKLNELLVRRENEMREIEAEVESYRKWFGDKLVADTDISSNPLFDFEDEKAYISDCLKKLERKLYMLSTNRMHVDISITNHTETSIDSDSNNGNHHLMDGNPSDLVAILNEVLRLNERLKVLEADRNFLEHTVNSLRNGNDGVRFIQEIVLQLQELRRIGITLGECSSS